MTFITISMTILVNPKPTQKNKLLLFKTSARIYMQIRIIMYLTMNSFD